MPKQRKPDFVEISENHVISTRGIMSIRQKLDTTVEVRYISGYTETVRGMSMEELLTKLGRNPRLKGDTDSGSSDPSA